jgi:hypothetical protein
MLLEGDRLQSELTNLRLTDTVTSPKAVRTVPGRPTPTAV